MPSRLIRDGLLDSERVQTLPIDARWLYVTILLLADDVGLFEATSFKLGRAAAIDHQSVPVLLQLLADADLVRLYEADGKRYGFIPRFRQRLQTKRAKHPLPPASLMADDQDALNKINNLALNPRLDCGDKPWITAAQPPEPEPEPEEETKKEPTALVERRASNAYRVPDCPYDELLAQFHLTLPMLPRIVVFNTSRKTALRARWVEVCVAEKFDRDAGLAWFGNFFRMVSRSAFLTGKAKKWKASFDWLLKPQSFAKAVEGNYQGVTP